MPPEPEIVATDVVPLVHDTPPELASDTCATAPTHSSNCPVIGAGAALTLILNVL